MFRRAFTLIEIIVTIALMAIFAGIAILSSRNGQAAMALSGEAEKIGQFALEAKSLALVAYSPSGSAICGYGVVVDPGSQTYSIFAYEPGGSPCPSADSVTVPGIYDGTEHPYSGGTWRVPTAQGVTISSGGVVLFYPPDPTVLGGGSFSLSGGGGSKTISVSSAGQVSF